MIGSILQGVSLAEPRYLIMLAIPGLLLMWVVLTKRRPNARLSNRRAAKPAYRMANGPWRYLLGGTLVAGMAAMPLLAARPVYGTTTTEPRSAVMLVIDVSPSMEATDVAPNRLEAVKATLSETVRKAPPELNIGLVIFSDVARPLVSPKPDRQELLDAIGQLQTGGQGTATGEGVISAVDLLDTVAGFGSEEPLPARIIVLSDGVEEGPAGRKIPDAVDAAEQSGYPVYTVSFGSDGAVFDNAVTGQPEVIESDPQALADMAAATGGVSYEAQTVSELASAFDSIPGAVAEKPAEAMFPRWLQIMALAAMVVFSIGFIAFRYS